MRSDRPFWGHAFNLLNSVQYFGFAEIPGRHEPRCALRPAGRPLRSMGGVGADRLGPCEGGLRSGNPISWPLRGVLRHGHPTMGRCEEEASRALMRQSHFLCHHEPLGVVIPSSRFFDREDEVAASACKNTPPRDDIEDEIAASESRDSSSHDTEDEIASSHFKRDAPRNDTF